MSIYYIKYPEIQSTLINYSVNMIVNTNIVNILGYHFLPIAADIDECQRNTHNCNVSANCTNTPGSFFCTCNPGYTGDGVVRCDGKICLYIICYAHTKADSAFIRFFKHIILQIQS